MHHLRPVIVPIILVFIIGCSVQKPVVKSDMVKEQQHVLRSTAASPDLRLSFEMPRNCIVGKECYAKAWLTNTDDKDIVFAPGYLLEVIAAGKDNKARSQGTFLDLHSYGPVTLKKGESTVRNIPVKISEPGKYTLVCRAASGQGHQLTPDGVYICGDPPALKAGPITVTVTPGPKNAASERPETLRYIEANSELELSLELPQREFYAVGEKYTAKVTLTNISNRHVVLYMDTGLFDVKVIDTSGTHVWPSKDLVTIDSLEKYSLSKGKSYSKSYEFWVDEPGAYKVVCCTNDGEGKAPPADKPYRSGGAIFTLHSPSRLTIDPVTIIASRDNYR
ncbi:MAG TPA: hypothetical protein VE439_01540 [Anaerolineae bacterium]|nr:hypothetical protein [Anaerolineae bacterium]